MSEITIRINAIALITVILTTKKAVEWYKKAMENGSLKAAYNYATMLHFRKGLKRTEIYFE